MATTKISGALLSQGQETSAHCSQGFQSKLFKMRLVESHPTIFGDYSPSGQWDLFANVMKNDFEKKRQLTFRHPKHKDKVYTREYIGPTANGIAFLMLGQFRNPLDYIFVRILPKSFHYGEPYLVFEKYAQSFHNLHILVEMVECAFNWVLQGTGVKLVLEPWVTDEKIIWCKDYSDSLMYEIIKSKGEGLTMVGYEDAVEFQHEYEARKAKEKKPKISKKSDDIQAYILTENKEAIVEFLHQAVKGQKTPKGIARPFRLLYDHQLTERIPYKAVIKEFPELKDLIKERGYNNWTNPNSTSYDYDPHYMNLKDKLILIS